MKTGLNNKACEGITPGVRVLSVLGPDGITIVHQVTGGDIEKVAGVVSRRVARKLKEASPRRAG